MTVSSARNGTSEVPLYFLNAKQGKMEKDKWKSMNKNKMRYGIPEYTSPFRALAVSL
jgi:hypothetical protein